MQEVRPLLEQEWSATAFHRAATQSIRAALAHRRPIALYGAGRTGQQIAGLLGQVVDRFLDDTPDKAGTRVQGLPVHAVDQGLASMPPGALVVVSIFSARHSFALTRQRLHTQFDGEVCSFAQVLHATNGALPNLYLGDITHQVAQRPRYERLAAQLADAHSRQVLDQHLRMRLLADFGALPDSRAELSFLGLADRDAPSFVDGGAFDGDTLRDFLTWRRGRFSSIVAYEPDPRNFQQLQAWLGTCPPADRQRVTLRQAALWSSRTQLAFDATGQVGSTLSTDGKLRVDTDWLPSLDHLPDPLLIKLDVEGAEGEVLRGAIPWLRQRRPMLGLSVYHRPDDLLELFDLVESLGLPYRYHLRCHGGDGTDLVLYCVDDSATRIGAGFTRCRSRTSITGTSARA